MLIVNCSLLLLVFFHCSLASYQEPNDNSAFNDLSGLSLNSFNSIQPKSLVQSIPPSPYTPIKPALNPYTLQFNPILNPSASLVKPILNFPTQPISIQSLQNFQYKPSLIPHNLTLSKQTCFQPPKNLLEPKALHSVPPTLEGAKLSESYHSHLPNNGQDFQSNFSFSESDHNDQILQNQQLLVQVPQSQQFSSQMLQNYQISNQNISQADPDDSQDVSQVDSDDDNDNNHTNLFHTSKSKKVRSDKNIKRSLANLFGFHPTNLPKYEFVGGEELTLSFRELLAIKDICAFDDTLIIFEKSSGSDHILISYKCIVCDRVFKDRYKYRNHADAHRNIRRYKCNLCSKCFTQRCSHNRHKKKHLEGFKFKCSICNLFLPTKSDRITHEKTHVDPTR